MAQHPRFAVCVQNAGNEASLELRKLYEIISDPDAEKDGMLRVIDESGEDYSFPAHFFVAGPFACSRRKSGRGSDRASDLAAQADRAGHPQSPRAR
jgi:hypothetical protein